MSFTRQIIATHKGGGSDLNLCRLSCLMDITDNDIGANGFDFAVECQKNTD